MYAIETKCWTKPPPDEAAPGRNNTRRATVVVKDGKLCDANGRPMPDVYQGALGQAEASARRIRQILKEAYGAPGSRVPVRPVLAVVGWWVEQPQREGKPAGETRGAWTINPKQFYALANRQLETLSDTEAARYAEHLRHVVRRTLRDAD